MVAVSGGQGGCSFNSLEKLSCPLPSTWAAGLRCQRSLPLWSRSSAQPLHWGTLQTHCGRTAESKCCSKSLPAPARGIIPRSDPHPKEQPTPVSLGPCGTTPPNNQSRNYTPSKCMQTVVHSVSAGSGYRLVVV